MNDLNGMLHAFPSPLNSALCIAERGHLSECKGESFVLASPSCGGMVSTLASASTVLCMQDQAACSVRSMQVLEAIRSLPLPPGLVLPSDASYSVDKANQDSSSGKSPNRPASSCKRRLKCRVIFPAVDPELDAEFDLVPRLIGRGGCNTKDIAAVSKGKLLIRGSGSSGRRSRGPAVSDTPLQMLLEGCDAAAFEAGKQKLMALLDSVAQHFERYCRKKGFAVQAKFYSLVHVQ